MQSLFSFDENLTFFKVLKEYFPVLFLKLLFKTYMELVFSLQRTYITPDHFIAFHKQLYPRFISNPLWVYLSSYLKINMLFKGWKYGLANKWMHCCCRGPNLIPITQVSQLTTACNCSFTGTTAIVLFWYLCAAAYRFSDPTQTQRHSSKYTHAPMLLSHE